MGIWGERMRKEQTPPEDNTEAVYKPDGPSLQDLLERLFKVYLQSGGLPGQGETDDGKP